MGHRDVMKQFVEENPGIGRRKLAAVAGVTEETARRFLEQLRNPQTAPTSKEETPKVNPFDELHPKEQKLILDGLKSQAPMEPKVVEWQANSFKFAGLGDTHWGHVESKEEHWQRACSIIKKEGCQFVLHTGDLTEGMSGRDGHVYELNAIGAKAQIDLAVQRVELLDVPMYGINGNHDLWGYKKIGHDVAATLEDRLPGKFINLGIHEADFSVGNIVIKLFHGEDGASYATSYRTQKFIENLAGGEKPNILLAGHDHKSIFHMCRNVAVFGTGTLCKQTRWMRNKKLACHLGLWIIEVWPNEHGIERIQQQWIPFFRSAEND